MEADRPLPEKYRFLLFDEKCEVELIWNGKSNEACNIVLPFQTIEQVDEPRAEKLEQTALQADLFAMDNRGRQLQGWTNKLIWGDNKLILSSLKNGPLHEEIKKQGGLKLIYIDPPFDVGADFSMDIEIGGDTFTKKPNILEEIAYRDTWGQGADSFDGSIYVHGDWRVNGYIRLVMDEVFGTSNLLNHISWKRTPFAGSSKARAKKFPTNQDSIFFMPRIKRTTFSISSIVPYSEEYKARFKYQDQRGFYRKTLLKTYSQEIERRLKKEDRWIDPGKPGSYPSYKQYLHESQGKQIEDIWVDINSANPMADERVAYPTQKPEALWECITKASSNVGDLVADFFCGPAPWQQWPKSWGANGYVLISVNLQYTLHEGA